MKTRIWGRYFWWIRHVFGDYTSGAYDSYAPGSSTTEVDLQVGANEPGWTREIRSRGRGTSVHNVSAWTTI
jgi:hypothetical protein